jgi:2-C-methyl-D-erythritol 4-phosphate cytidylyltransferase
MNVAVIFAGGVGRRMNNTSTPKQFLLLHQKPIIIHTLEVFENHPQIDGICISCLESHIEHMKRLCQRFAITKVRWIVPGGTSGQESIFHGIRAVQADCPGDTAVLIHDGVRPNISLDLISENIRMVREKGNGISCTKATETHASVDEEGRIVQIADRDNSVIAKAPQSFLLGEIYSAHLRAREEGLSFVDSASLMRHYGHRLNVVMCPWDNIKITTPSDFYIFRAILEAKENSQIFGL